MPIESQNFEMIIFAIAIEEEKIAIDFQKKIGPPACDTIFKFYGYIMVLV